MRPLLEECVPGPLKHELRGHIVGTVRDMGWSGTDNGELLVLMLANGFEGFITVDQNLEFQQNVSAAGLAVLGSISASRWVRSLRSAVSPETSAPQDRQNRLFSGSGVWQR